MPSLGNLAIRPLFPWRTPLRAWQARAFEQIVSHEETDFLAVATPGAGKTRLALRVAHHRLATRQIDRIVVVCPTNHLREQWAEAAHKEGLHLAPDVTNQQGWEAADYHGLTVSYQQVCFEPGLYRRGTRTRRTLVIFDEIHHAGDGKGWGDALRQAFDEAAQRLLLSGTPFRTDSNPIPYVRYNEEHRSLADFTYGYPEALRDGVCRSVLFPAYEGDVSWISKGEMVVATFQDALREEWRRERLKTALLQDEWLGEVIRDANHKLSEMRANGHHDAGGLIVTMTQAHAREVAHLVEHLIGERPMVAVSEDPEASAAIRAFGMNRARWLVAVNMVSEGVDIPRLRVGIYATNILTEMYFRQVVGRFVRMIRTGDPDRHAYLYIPRDPVLVSYARKIKEERKHALIERDDEEAGLADRVSPERAPDQGYEPLGAIARVAECIGRDEHLETEPSPNGGSVRERPLYEIKQERRTQHKRLVGLLAARERIEHRLINWELKERTGNTIESATIRQLEQRIKLLQRWLDKGFEGRR